MSTRERETSGARTFGAWSLVRDGSGSVVLEGIIVAPLGDPTRVRHIV